MQNYIDKMIDRQKDDFTKLRNSIELKFRQLTSKQAGIIKRYLVACEGYRWLEHTRSSRFAFAFHCVRDLTPRGRSNDQYTLELFFGHIGNRPLRFYVPSNAVADDEGFARWLSEIEKKTNDRCEFLKQVELDDLRQRINKNKRFARGVLEGKL